MADALEAYLAQVERHLRGLSPAEAREVIAELRSHVLDRTEGTPTPERVAEALAALGEPRALARLNVAERVAGRAEGASSPLTLFGVAAQLAALSLQGLWIFLVSLLGYGVAATWLFVAAAKPFAPGRVGLWHVPDPNDSLSFSLGAVRGAAPGQELLGWWIIPLGLALGVLLAWLTWLFDRKSLTRMARGYRSRA